MARRGAAGAARAACGGGIHRGAAAEPGAARGCAPVGRDRLRGTTRARAGRGSPGAQRGQQLFRRRRRRRGPRCDRSAGDRGCRARGHGPPRGGAVPAAAHGADRAHARAGAGAAAEGDARWQGARAAGALRMIRIHNSLTGQKEQLRPITPGQLRMYVCGLTVYDYVHVGHARMLLVFDVITRYLRERGLQLTYVRNITDIDDKIIRRAAENGESIGALTARFIAAMHEDCARLNILPPDREPRATEFVPQIIAMVQELIRRDYAYVAVNGDVMYAVARFAGYGRLSGKRLADLRAGARVEVDEAKRDPLDFVLWKQAKPGEPAWDSPWGPGRPGWHIECSAMSMKYLGETLDIHGGGLDLMFPHHENELAQSESCTGKPFSRYWMHNGLMQSGKTSGKVGGGHDRHGDAAPDKEAQEAGKLAGSKGAASVKELFARHAPETVRFFVLSTHYRSPIDFSDDNTADTGKALEGF